MRLMSKNHGPLTLIFDWFRRQMAGGKPRYDSVGGIHPSGQTPIFITYTSAATSYPAYLLTWTAQ